MLNTITLPVNAVAYEHYFSNISNYHCSSALKISASVLATTQVHKQQTSLNK